MHCGHFTTSCCAFKTAFQENKLDEEIDWGLNIRRDRHQEKDIILAQDPVDIIVPKPKQRKKKRIKRRPKVKEIPVCQKLSERITFNRDTATFKQYIDILARPRPVFCPLEEEEVPKNVGKGVCSPRTAQMALPLKKRVFHTWKDYYDVLTPEQITSLKEFLTKEEHLLPMEAYNYFKRLKREQQKKRRQKKKEEIKIKLEKPKKSKIMREINCLAKCIVHYFSEKMLQTVKCNHMCLTDLIKTKLEQYHLIPPGYERAKEKDVCGRTLFETLDQLSVWLESNISWDDEPSDDEKAATPPDEVESEEEKEESEVSSATYYSSEEEGSEIEIVGKKEGEEEGEEEGQEEGEGEGKRAEREGEGGAAEMGSEAGSELSAGEGLTDAEAEAEAAVAAAAAAEQEMLLSTAGESEITDISKLSKIDEKSIQKEEDIIKEMEQAAEDVYSAAGKAESVKSAEGVEEVMTEKVAPTVESSAASSIREGEESVEPTEESLKDLAESLDELIAKATSAESGMKIDEHSPDAVCCVTLKTWATWLVDVAQNTHNWCQWIQEVIAKVRFFAAILKGEVKTPDGKIRILFKEEWEQFTDLLACDIESWQKYKQHVKELSDKIIEGFQNKRVICCSACLKSKLIISAETAHQVTEQLVEALNTTAYWRGWLDAIVEEAKKLASLDFELPSKAAIISADVSSGSYESSRVYEIIELKSPSKTSSDQSVFFIEEINSNKSDSFVIEEITETSEEAKDTNEAVKEDDGTKEPRRSSGSKKS